jgi:hypothetical protein
MGYRIWVIVMAFGMCGIGRSTGIISDDKTKKEDAAVKFVEELGGQVERNAQGRVVFVNFNLSLKKVTDRDLKQLGVFTEVERLSLSMTEVTDAGVKELAPLTNLTTLDLYGTPVTGAGLNDGPGHEESSPSKESDLALSFQNQGDRRWPEIVGPARGTETTRTLQHRVDGRGAPASPLSSGAYHP